MKSFEYTVNCEEFKTDQHVLTPDQILEKAKLDPGECYLVEIKGREQVSFQGRGAEQLHVHEHMKFIAVCTGATPVSGV